MVGKAMGRLLDAVAPRRCAGCAEPAPEVLCETCVGLIVGLPLPPATRHGHLICRAALGYVPPVSGVIHRAKYRGCRRAMHLLAAVAAERLAPQLLALPRPDMVVPVPLGRRRQRARGYNQAEVVAQALAGTVPGATLATALRRRRETGTQVGQHRSERRRNLRGAFVWEGRTLSGLAVWLVDDVVTTGATLVAAAEALQQGGAARIEAVAVAATAG
jgi:ComF family protein